MTNLIIIMLSLGIFGAYIVGISEKGYLGEYLGVLMIYFAGIIGGLVLAGLN